MRSPSCSRIAATAACAVLSLSTLCQAENIGARIGAPSDVALAVRPTTVHPSCVPAAPVADLLTGTTIGEFACTATDRAIICVRGVDGNAPSIAITRKLAGGIALNRAELSSIDALMYGGLDALLVANSSGVQELQRALRQPNDQAMLSRVGPSRNRGFISAARSPNGRTFLPPGASAIVELAYPLSIGRDLYYVSDVTVNAGATLASPDAPAVDYIAIRSNRANGTALVLSPYGFYRCSSEGWKQMADDANIESLDKPKIILVEQRLRRRSTL